MKLILAGFFRIFVVIAACGVSGAVGLGCKVDQEKEVETYRAVLDLKKSEYKYGDAISLRDALLLANANNETLSVQGEDYLQAIIGKKRAVANFLPTADLRGEYSRRDPVPPTSPGGTSNNASRSTFDVFADLNINVFNGFSDINRYWSSTFRIEQRRNDLLDAQESLLVDVALSYYRVLRAEALVRVLESSLAVQEERLRDTRGRYAAGVTRPLDVAQSEAQVAATRTLLVDARRDAVSGRELLVLLTAELAARHVPLSDAYDLPRRVEPLMSYLATSFSSRRDLTAADAAVNAARRDVEVAWGQYYPSVNVNFSAFLYRESVPEDRDWQGLLAINLPLFSAGRIEADVRDAWSFFRQSLLVRNYLRRQVEQQVREAYEELSASESRLRSLGTQLTAAEQAFRQSEASYRAGLATNLDRVAAQDALLDAQLQFSSEAFFRKLRYLSLLRRAGRMRQELEQMPVIEPGSASAPMWAATTQPTTGPVDGFDLAPATQPVLQRSSRDLLK